MKSLCLGGRQVIPKNSSSSNDIFKKKKKDNFLTNILFPN